MSSKKKKDREKSFVNRSLLWLQRSYPDLYDYADRWSSVPAGVFPKDTPAGELWQLVLQTLSEIEAERGQLVVNAEDIWKQSRMNFLEVLQGIETPSLTGIGAIEQAAALFLEAGGTWKKVAAETERQRGAVRDVLREAGDLEGVADVLARLPTLDSARVARLHEEAEDVRGLLTGLRECGKRIAEKASSFDRLRREEEAWSRLAPQAAALAALEEERKVGDEAVAAAISRMAAVLDLSAAGMEARAEPVHGSAKRGKRNARAPAPEAVDTESECREEGEPESALPGAWSDLNAWCSEHLKGRLALSPRARNSMKKALYQDVGTAARCLLWLAGAYRRSRLEGCGEGVQGAVPGLAGLHNERCGGDAFEFAWSGRRPVADWHVKGGGNSRDPARCLRIYYCWDDASGMVLVGDMPGHVRSRAT